MPIVTGIVASPRKEGRWVVQVDGAPLATLSIAGVERLALRVGLALGEAGVAAIQHEGAVIEALDRALNMLAFRARSSRELRRALLRKVEDAAVVDAAIARLTESGLLNDADYARQFARAKALGPGLSKRRLQQELFRKGVTRDVADEAVTEVLADESVDQGEILERVARKKLRTLAAADPPTRRRRLYGYLARRGYESDDIRRVLDELLAGDSGDEGDSGESGDEEIASE